MLANAEFIKFHPGQWEQRLANQTDSLQRLALLDQLIGHYAYTNVSRAQVLLEEQWGLLQAFTIDEFKYRYYLHKIVVENQLYCFNDAALTAREAIDYLEGVGSFQELMEIYTEYAGVCQNLLQMDEAEQLIHKVSKLLKQFPSRAIQSQLACRKGYLYLARNNYAASIEQFLEADALSDYRSEVLRDQYFRTLIFSGLGTLHNLNGAYEKSARAFVQVVKLCERLSMTNRLAWHYQSVGRAYLALSQIEKAKKYFNKAIDTRDDLSLQARASAYANLGFCHYDEGEYEKCLELLDRADHLYKEISPEDSSNRALIHRGKANSYQEMGDIEKALEAFKEAYDLAEQGNAYKIWADICRDIAALYAQNGDFEQAYNFQLTYDQVNERYLEEADLRQQKELEVKYEAAKKEQEAELLQLKATQLQLKALRAQMNPHFIFNALNAIQSCITTKDPGTSARYLAKFAKMMRQSLEYSDQEVISLEKEIEFLEDYLYLNQHLRFDDKMRYKIEVDEDIEEDIMGVPTMIVQPYVENAIEHGLRSKTDGMIHINFRLLDDDTICCVVEDNGIGRDKAFKLQQQDPDRENYRSRGTQITERRLELLHQTKGRKLSVKTIDLFHTKTKLPKGTRVEIHIPIVEIQVK